MKIRPKVRDAVRVKPGDLVAVLLEGHVTVESCERMAAQLRSLWPEVKVALFQNVTDVAVFRPVEELDAP